MFFRRHPARKLTAIYAGGVAGALLRIGLAEAFPAAAGTWPWPTLAANLTGAFLIGWLFAALTGQAPGRLHHPFLVTGFCGALTTFSTLQLELFEMLESGHTGLAAAYVSATLLLGYGAVEAGVAAERRTPRRARV